ncbi:putative PIN and TRAM-domain containing protein YacL [subsurface metagenome]
MSSQIFLRVVGMLVFGAAGWGVSTAVDGSSWTISLTLGAAALGLAITPYLTRPPYRWVSRQLSKIPTYVLLTATIGLVIALLISVLLALPLSRLPGLWGDFTPLAVSLFLCFISISVMVMRGRELFQMFGIILPERSTGAGKIVPHNGQVIVDTSAIIDGRIADVSETGFIPGSLIIPRFVLDELHHIADSYDSVRRSRGRRGLEMLSKLQKESGVSVEITEMDVKDVREVDAKLVKLAKIFGCAILTNDFNLNRVAELQGVQVLNVNELANAVRPVVLPGEEMAVRIIQEGKEFGQGVGFLDDGTMIVVEGGRRYINSRIDVVVTRVLQTAAGRMIFAHPKVEQE